MCVVEREHGDTQFVRHFAGYIAVVERCVTVLYDHKDVLEAILVVNLEVGEEIVFNLIRLRVDDFLAGSYTIFVEVLSRLDVLDAAVSGCNTE